MPAPETAMRRVTAINNGTVLDHIPAGKALLVLKMLGLDGKMATPVSLVMNVPSGKMGEKDIVKVEDRELSQSELDRLSLIAPHASVAIIRSYNVAEKRVVNLGEEVVNVISCCFNNCASLGAREPLDHRLKVATHEPLSLRCHYCGRTQDMGALVENLL